MAPSLQQPTVVIVLRVVVCGASFELLLPNGRSLQQELRVSALMDDDLEDIWKKYDIDGNG